MLRSLFPVVVVILVVMTAFVCAPPVRAAAPGVEAFAALDLVPDRMQACSGTVTDTAASPADQVAALGDEVRCLTDLAGEIADAFYPAKAFGKGRDVGLKPVLIRLNGDLQPMFLGLQTRPLACDPKCDAFYAVQAGEMHVRFLKSLILEMTDRLKDDSPIHTE